MGDSAFEFLFSLNGRVGRLVFWLHQFLATGVILILGFVIEAVHDIGGDAGTDRSVVFELVTIGIMISALVAGAFGLWSFIAIKVKRWHDRDKSGHWIWLELVPFVGPIWALIECGFLPGTAGPNQFGSEPYF